MTQHDYIPEISINNVKQKEIVTIGGQEQEVEIPAKEGFNIKAKDLENNYKKDYFLKELEGVILFDRYQIKSKYNSKPMYFSNEFEFIGPKNNLRVYSPEEKATVYEGDWAGAKEQFATGQMSAQGRPQHSYDVYSVLYFSHADQIFRFIWKMNTNNNWFDYKSGTEKINGKDGYRGIKTKFALEEKEFGSIKFWTCNLQNIGEVDQNKYNDIADDLIKELDAKD